MSDLVDKAMDAVADLDGLELAEYWHERAKAITAELIASRAELSRLSALVAEWQKAAEPFAALLADGWGSALPSDSSMAIWWAGEDDRKRPSIEIGAFRRLSQLKDTTNADK